MHVNDVSVFLYCMSTPDPKEWNINIEYFIFKSVTISLFT